MGALEALVPGDDVLKAHPRGGVLHEARDGIFNGSGRRCHSSTHLVRLCLPPADHELLGSRLSRVRLEDAVVVPQSLRRHRLADAAESEVERSEAIDGLGSVVCETRVTRLERREHIE